MALEELLLAGLSSTGLLKAGSKHEGRKPERNPLPMALGCHGAWGDSPLLRAQPGPFSLPTPAWA